MDSDKLLSFIVGILANNSLLIFLGTIELTISTIVQEKNSSSDTVWILEMALSWFLVVLIYTLMYGLFTKIKNIFGDFLLKMFFIVFVLATVVFYGIELVVISDHFDTLYFIDIYYELLYANIVFLICFFIHAKYVSRNPIKYQLQLDCLQIINGLYFYLLILCCSNLKTEENGNLTNYIWAGFIFTFICFFANYMYYFINNRTLITKYSKFKGEYENIKIDGQNVVMPKLHMREIFILKSILFLYYAVLWPICLMNIYNIEDAGNFNAAVGYCSLSFISFTLLFVLSFFKTQIIRDTTRTSFFSFGELNAERNGFVQNEQINV